MQHVDVPLNLLTGGLAYDLVAVLVLVVRVLAVIFHRPDSMTIYPLQGVQDGFSFSAESFTLFVEYVTAATRSYAIVQTVAPPTILKLRRLNHQIVVRHCLLIDDHTFR